MTVKNHDVGHLDILFTYDQRTSELEAGATLNGVVSVVLAFKTLKLSGPAEG